MLRGLRTASSGWLGKTVMAIVVGLLVISFAYWGIGDVFKGPARGAVAQVGGTWYFGGNKLSIEQYQRLYQDRLQTISRQIRRPLTPEMARSFGIDRQVLRQWVEDAVLDARVRTMRLGVTDADVVRRLMEDPAFQGTDKQFDPKRFQFVLQQLGQNEQTYVAEQRRETLRRQITSTVVSEFDPPKAIAEAINRFQNEQREADYVTLTPAQAGDIAAPAPDVLAKYFEDRKALFRAPEYRAATVLPLTAEEIGRTIEVSADEIKAFYDKNTERFGVPEKRQVQQILFTDKEAAHKAADRLAGGLSFDELIKEPDIKDKFSDLGLVPKLGVGDQKVADVAFSLPVDKPSGAIDELYVSTIVRVTKVEPGSQKTLAEVEGEIKKGLTQERAVAVVRKMRDQVDEEVGGGANLKEIADKLKLPIRQVAALDRSGRDPDGKPVDLPKGADLLDNIFATQKGVENEPLQTQDGGLIWYEVTGITESRQHTLDEVTDTVEARGRDDEIVKRLTAKVTEMVDKLKGGTKLADLAAADKLKVEHTAWLKRRDASATLPPEFIAAIFRTEKGAPGSSEGKTPTERMVFVVTTVTVPTFMAGNPDTKPIVDAVKTGMANDIYAQYLARAENDVGVTFDQAALADALGGAKQ
jgi:peptidyl-prolyl cis-trans isomerase D